MFPCAWVADFLTGSCHQQIQSYSQYDFSDDARATMLDLMKEHVILKYLEGRKHCNSNNFNKFPKAC